jgi:putative modified peptide
MSEQQANQQRRAAVEQVVDRLANDPTFRQQLQSNPTEALQTLGLTSQTEGDDVAGYMMCQTTCGQNPLHTCNSGTCDCTTTG